MNFLFFIIFFSLKLQKTISQLNENRITCYSNLNNNRFNCCEKDKILLAGNETIWKSKQLELKIIAFKNMKLLKEERLLEDLDLVSLDLSNNRDTFEDISIMERINSFTNLTTLNLSQNCLSQIRTNQFNRLARLQLLDLSFNQIFYFEENSFTGLSSLIYLNLSKNYLNEIEENDLDHMPQAKQINLDFNKIKKIRSKVFTSMSKLSTISLRFNKIETIANDSFQDLMLLEQVKLNGNKLKGINRLIEIYSTVSDLDLSGNLAGNFIPFQQITTIRSLNLAKNNISQISDYSFNYYKTERNAFLELYNLSLAFNKLNQISQLTFQGLTSLKYLDLSNNIIEILTAKFIISTPSLIGLNLRNNRIKSLDGVDWRKNLLNKVLKIINVEKNLLSKISLSNFPDSLTELYLKSNPLNQIDAIDGLENADLSLSFNNRYFLNILHLNVINNLTFFFEEINY